MTGREGEAYEAGRLAGCQDELDAENWRGVVRGMRLHEESDRFMRWVYRLTIAALAVAWVLK